MPTAFTLLGRVGRVAGTSRIGASLARPVRLLTHRVAQNDTVIDPLGCRVQWFRTQGLPAPEIRAAYPDVARRKWQPCTRNLLGLDLETDNRYVAEYLGERSEQYRSVLVGSGRTSHENQFRPDLRQAQVHEARQAPQVDLES
jgi:hypothetical protein